ncbi:class I SAM-dependent methyltransferase [Catellatospora tritici]|uniref:methyltransferase domain-containing protein n=1 Tax=Catellatospora tritici TaxID=2851566 RepID=UPI001C2D0708|nr:class I SAM-dependent methyltransferase [Catellatospora tritici]MBV1853017.1 class I SAM-dependent methyltransferase [Catellatospora tritici]
MPDEIFAHPRLARVYDAFDGDRADLDAYVLLAGEVGARHVLDLGCGTGALAVLLAARGLRVSAADPAAASLAVARTKPGAELVTWHHGDATTLPDLGADLAVMTGNVAQVFLSDDDWHATLRGLRGALRAGGHLAFETRRPQYRAWEQWAAEQGTTVREVPGIGVVEQRFELVEVALPHVSFRHVYRFSDGETVVSDSTLRFRSRDEIERSLAACGFSVREVRQAPDRPGREYVFLARRTD